MDDKTKQDKLSEIFESDLLGLLAVDEPKSTQASPQDSRLIDSFQEISEFLNKKIKSKKISPLHTPWCKKGINICIFQMP
jgi:hypothetical protein